MSAGSVVARLRSAQSAILPSMLLCDFGNLEREVRALEEAGVGCLHLDVMDGHFVPNLTYGPPLVEAVRRLTDLVIDVHLMISDPPAYIPQFASAGGDLLTVHAEVQADSRAMVEQIHAAGCAAGVAVNPGTPLEILDPVLDQVELVLVMSVQPGFGGQEFQRVALKRLSELRQRGPEQLLLEVDGGVNQHTIGDCAAAGADLFVVGSGVFKSDNYTRSVRELDAVARQARQ